MKKGWEIKKLSEVCDLKPPKKEAKDKLRDTDSVTFLPMEDLGVLGKEVIGVKERKLKDVTGSYTYFAENDLLLAKITPCFENGKIGIAKNLINGVGFGSSEYLVFRSKGEIIQEYLYYFLSRETFREEGRKRMTGAVGHKRVAKEFIENYPLPFPVSIPEQQRIVAILDEAFAAIAKAKANAEQNLKNAKELFESYLQAVFENKGEGWEEKKVSEIGKTQTGTTPKTVEKENYGDYIPFIKPADVDFSGVGDIRYDNEGLSEIGLEKGRKMESGSILMVCIGATIGKVGFAEKVVSCNQQINSLTVKKELEPKFIYYAMTSREFQNKVLSEGRGAQATLPIINKSKWENLTISFPKSKAEQKGFVAKFDGLQNETKKLEVIYQQKINDLEELKKSILQKAFSGELKTTKTLCLN
jgi:type I restriction enzyme, S subunit